MILILIGGICICSRRTRQKFLRPVTSRWTGLSYATGIASPARYASQQAARSGGDAHKSLVTEAEPMSGGVTGSNNNNIIVAAALPRDTMRSGNARSSYRVSTAPSIISDTSQSQGPLRQFPITKSFGRASWATRSWYGRSWHGRSWHASQTFAPPMSQFPDPPPPPPAAATYSVFPRTSGISSVGAESSVYEDSRMTTQLGGTTSFYGTGLRPAPPGQASSAGGGNETVDHMDIPQVVIYSPTPRVSAQTPVIVDLDYSAASGAHAREASQASMHSGHSGDSPGGASIHSMAARDGSNENSSRGVGGGVFSFAPSTGTGGRDTTGTLVEVTDIPRRPPAAMGGGAGPTTLSRFSQVSDLSSASANTGYSWEDGASEPYTANRASTLSRIAGGLSILADRNNPPPPRNYYGDGATAPTPRRP